MKDAHFDAIAARALELIEPSVAEKGTCREQIITDLRQLVEIKPLTDMPSPGELRDLMLRFAAAARRLAAAENSLPAACRGLVFEAIDRARFAGELDRLIQTATYLGKHLHVPHGSQVHDPVKQMAARYARTLLKRFSDKEPTMTAGGSYFELSTLLYEGATGKAGASLERYCRDPENVAPTYVLKIPFVRQ